MDFLGQYQTIISSFFRGQKIQERYRAKLRSSIAIQNIVRQFLFQRKRTYHQQNKLVLKNFVSVLRMCILLRRRISEYKERQDQASVIIQKYIRRFLFQPILEESNIMTNIDNENRVFFKVDLLDIRHAYMLYQWKKQATIYARINMQKNQNESKIFLKRLIENQLRRLQEQKFEQASKILQKSGRYFLTAKRNSNATEKKYQIHLSSTKKIQKRWRHYKRWTKIIQQIEASEREFKLYQLQEIKLVQMIEKHWNLYKMRENARQLLFEKKLFVLRKQVERNKAYMIQRLWKTNLTQRIQKELKIKRKEYCVSILQKFILRTLKQIFFCRCAKIIQLAYRRRLLQVLKGKMTQKSAVNIQKWYRLKQYRKKLARMKMSCLKIQRAYRSYLFLKVIRKKIRKHLEGRRVDYQSHIKNILNQSRNRRIQIFLHRRDEDAAKKIQQLFRKYLVERQFTEDEVSVMEQAVNEKRIRILRREGKRKMIQDVFNSTKLRKFRFIMQNSATGVNNFVPSKIRDKAKKKKISKKKCPASIANLRQYSWFDMRLSKIMKSYEIKPSEIFSFHSIFRSLQVNEAVDTIDVYDFFDFLKEEKSEFGMWLFTAVNTETPNHISFSEFVHLVSYSCLLKKESIQILMFSSIDTEKNSYIDQTQWEHFVRLMIENESVQYGVNSAIKAFLSHAKRISIDKKQGLKLPFDGFKKVS